MGRSDRLDEELAGASLYVLCSRFEGLPMVMIEAMAHAPADRRLRLPDRPRDVITSEVTGCWCRPGTSTGWRPRSSRLMSDQALRTRMGAAAADGRELPPDSVMPLWEDLFTELLSREPIIDSYWTR